jgi:hypothetical protein
MRDKLQQQMRHAFEQLDKADPPHDMPTSAQVWSRLQFRVARRPRKNSYNPPASILLAALYVFAFLIRTTWSGWLSATLLAVLASAAVAATLLLVQVSRKFR